MDNKIPASVVNAIVVATAGTIPQGATIEAHMKEYFTRFPSYKGKFTDLEWYHIFLDFYEKIPAQAPAHTVGSRLFEAIPVGNEQPENEQYHYSIWDACEWCDGQGEFVNEEHKHYPLKKQMLDCQYCNATGKTNIRILREVSPSPDASLVEKFHDLLYDNKTDEADEGSWIESKDYYKVAEKLAAIAQGRIDGMAKEAERVKADLEVTEKLLSERQRVLDAIPECKSHGGNCVPHALEWVAAQIQALTANHSPLPNSPAIPDSSSKDSQ